MAKINALDFGNYVENCRKTLKSKLNNKFKIYSSSKSLSDLISDLDILPTQNISDDYWVSDDIDLRPLLNNPPFEGCTCAYGAVLYAVPTQSSSSWDGYTSPIACPGGAVIVRSDGVTIDNRDGSVSSPPAWDITKDIISEDGTYSMRYVIAYIYTESYNDIEHSVLNITGYSCLKSLALKNMNLNKLDFYIPSNKTTVTLPEFFYLDNTNIRNVFTKSSSVINMVRNICLKSSSITNFLYDSTRGYINYHENISGLNINTKINGPFPNLTNIADTLIGTINSNYINISNFIEMDITFDYEFKNYSQSSIPGPSCLVYRANFLKNVDMTASYITTTRSKRIYLDFSNIENLNINGIFYPTRDSTSTSGNNTYNTMVFDIKTPSGEIDFSLNLQESTNQTYSMSRNMCIQCYKNIFSKLKDFSGTNITKTIVIGSRMIEILSDEVAAAQLKGWTVS